MRVSQLGRADSQEYGHASPRTFWAVIPLNQPLKDFKTTWLAGSRYRDFRPVWFWLWRSSDTVVASWTIGVVDDRACVTILSAPSSTDWLIEDHAFPK